MSLTKEKTLELLWQRMAERGDFPSLQRSVTGIVSAMQSENTSTADLASSVLSDFALTQKVIRLANSAMYAPFGCNVTTVSRAIMILGVDTIGHLALSLKLLEGFGEVAAGRDDMARELARATLAGAFARDITSKNGIRDGEEAVVCTLLHHVARLLVTYCFPDEWVEIQRLAEQQGISDSDACEQVLAISFPELSEAAARKWGLPESIATSMRPIDLEGDAPLSHAERVKYTAGTKLAPTDGIVRQTSDRIVGDAANDLDKARRIYDWVVANTYRRASTRGCGDGNVVAMLQSGDLGGKCADINPLFVALVRAAGIPARDLYGVRVAPSAFGYKSLGVKGGTITRAQHCRAEIYLDGYGWVATDPADVRKVMLEEEKGGLPASDPRVVAVRRKLFGAWEGNWIAFNDGADLALPDSGGQSVAFLMYPQGEVERVRLDCLEPGRFRYGMTAREITA